MLNTKPRNLFEAGVLLGEGFSIHKSKGLPSHSGDNIQFVYKSEAGEIHSFGEDFADCFVLLPGGIKVMLTNFCEHHAAESFLEEVINKIGQEEKGGPQL